MPKSPEEVGLCCDGLAPAIIVGEASRAFERGFGQRSGVGADCEGGLVCVRRRGGGEDEVKSAGQVHQGRL